MKIKSLLVKQYTDKGLMLNESVSKNGKYILEGPFGIVSDSPNNNGRIYTKEEYLPHIKELREDIKNGTPILGEIDHPEDRFEVKLKEASHRVIDLWFDNAKNMVMGKIELLNTPNGKILQSLVEQHIPIFISSRAAGTVGPDNKVNIKRIFTWDAVYKPGFKECKLELVNESYRVPVSEFLNKTVETKKNIANEFDILNENIEIYEMEKLPNLKFKKELSAKDLEALTKPISESDEKDKKIKEEETTVDTSDLQTENDSALTPAGNDMPQVSNEDLAAKLGLPSEAQDATERIEKDKSKDELFLDIEGEYSKDEETEDSDDEDDSKESGDADGFILDIEAEGDSDDEETEDSDDEDDSKDEKEDKEESDDDKEESDETEDEKEEKPKKSKKEDKDEKDLEENLSKKTPKVNVDKYKKLIDKYKTNEAEKLEFVSKYPKFANLNVINKEFFMTTLSESEREAFHDAAVLNAVNESEEFINKYYNLAYGEYMADKAMPTEERWLKYAPTKYKKVYEGLNALGKKKINDLAECFVLNNQDDVNSFWKSTGLLKRVQSKEVENLAYDATNESEQSIYEEEEMYDATIFKTFESKMRDLNNGEYDLV